MTDEFEIASIYTAAGLSVLPLRLDGSKAPASCLPRDERGKPVWGPYKERIATPDELSAWFDRPRGIGIIGGVVSGGLEIFDFDDGSLFWPWLDSVDDVVQRLPIIKTPSGGYHVFYRCEVICNSKKIATDPSREKWTLIETRGQYGYVAAIGSPPAIHKCGPYRQLTGPALPTIPHISPDDRKRLWEAAAVFDLGAKAELVKQREKQLRREMRVKAGLSSDSSDDSTPWGDFAIRGSWADILEPKGWTTRDGEHWVRPNKDFGTSAVIGIASDGHEILTVFSSNAGPLAAVSGHRIFGKFEAYCLLHHGGDRRLAARALRAQGYGKAGGKAA